jgi:glycosyltransferase involved in cell wall biosynthesis
VIEQGDIEMNPSISVVLPVHNGARYLRQSINSIVDQSFCDWELIIVDDGSTDDTSTIIHQSMGRDSRIRCYHLPENVGLPAALNCGFRLARGEYLTWTSDDNYYYKHAFAGMKTMLDQNVGSALVYASYNVIDEYGRFIGQRMTEKSEAICYSNIVGPCFLYRCEVMEAIGEYNESIMTGEDLEFFMRAYQRYEFLKLEDVLYAYRCHPESLSSKCRQNIRKLREDILLRWMPSRGRAGRTPRMKGYVLLAELAARRRDTYTMIRYLKRAIYEKPVVAAYWALYRFGINAKDWIFNGKKDEAVAR